MPRESSYLRRVDHVHEACIERTHSILGVDKRVVDGNDLDLGVLGGVAEDDTSNTAEAVDANLDGCHFVF